MDSFGNYPRERPFDPFSVMLFKGLQVIAFLFFIALLSINPEAKTGKIDTKAEYIIAMNWLQLKSPLLRNSALVCLTMRSKSVRAMSLSIWLNMLHDVFTLGFLGSGVGGFGD